jgi:hypothetical protein
MNFHIINYIQHKNNPMSSGKSISLLELKRQLEKLNEIQLQEIYKIIVKNSEKYTTNTNGIFVNISILKKDTINEIVEYIEFCGKNDAYLEAIDKDRQHEIS